MKGNLSYGNILYIVILRFIVEKEVKVVDVFM